MTEGELREADRKVQRLMELEQEVYWPKQDITFTSLYPVRTASGLRFRSADGKMRDWSNIEITPGFFDRTDAAGEAEWCRGLEHACGDGGEARQLQGCGIRTESGDHVQSAQSFRLLQHGAPHAAGQVGQQEDRQALL